MKGIIVLAHSAVSKEAIRARLDKGDLLIGVDAGCDQLYDIDLIPDLAIGDFDSVAPHVLDAFRALNTEILAHPADKDMTDGELAIRTALERGCSLVEICGTEFSGETDHFLGNILLLYKYPEARIFSDRETIRLAGPGERILRREDGEHVSFLPLEVTDLRLEGFVYDGTYQVNLGDTTTLRNTIRRETAGISIKTGKILVIQRK